MIEQSRTVPGDPLFRHGRACPGHPAFSCSVAVKTWVPGTSQHKPAHDDFAPLPLRRVNPAKAVPHGGGGAGGQRRQNPRVLIVAVERNPRQRGQMSALSGKIMPGRVVTAVLNPAHAPARIRGRRPRPCRHRDRRDGGPDVAWPRSGRGWSPSRRGRSPRSAWRDCNA